MRTQQRYDVLDGIRGVSALAVMFYHFTLNTPIAIFSHGYIAVDLFFMLSGFIISARYHQPLLIDMPPGEFMLKRLIRLYPMFLISLIIAIPALALFKMLGQTNYSLRDIVDSSLCNLLFIPYLNDGQITQLDGYSIQGVLFPANGPAWSLFFELIASAGFLIMVRLDCRHLTTILFISLLLLISGGVLHGFSSYNTLNLSFNKGWGTVNFLGGFPRCLFSFILGMLLFRLKDHPMLIKASQPFHLLYDKPWLIYSILLAILLYSHELRGIYYLMSLCVILPVILFIGMKTTCPDRTSHHIAMFLGWISFPVYCLQTPIMRLVNIFCLTKHHPFNWQTVAIAVMITLMSAILLAKYIEEPLRKYLTTKLQHYLADFKSLPLENP